MRNLRRTLTLNPSQQVVDAESAKSWKQVLRLSSSRTRSLHVQSWVEVHTRDSLYDASFLTRRNTFLLRPMSRMKKSLPKDKRVTVHYHQGS